MSILNDVVVPDSSFFDPDELWGRTLEADDPACALALEHKRLRSNPPREWVPLVPFHTSARKASQAGSTLRQHGIKLSSNLKTLICLSLARHLSCQMTRWCRSLCYGKSQNMCRPNAADIFISNFHAFERLLRAPAHEVAEVADAILTICRAYGISNLRVPGIGDFTPGLIRVIDVMTGIDPDFTVWGFTRRADLCSKLMPVRDNLVIWASIDASMSERRIQNAVDFSNKHGTGLSYSTEFGLAYQPRQIGRDPEPPWWDPPLLDFQPMAAIDPFLEELMDARKVSVVFGYHGRGRTTHVDVSFSEVDGFRNGFRLEPTLGYPECPATDPLGGAHFLGACQECYWCIEKPKHRPYRDLAEARLNKIVTILHGKHRGQQVLLDTGERV